MSRLLLIGWDAADWKIIDPLLANGEMPHLAGIIKGGVRGNLATVYPPISPMVWTSIATGKRPHKHGIHGFIEPTPDGLGVQPVSVLGRKSKAFWNILHQNGRRSIVVGWWPSHPAEPIRGAMVSNHFALSTGDHPGSPLRPDAVWPESWAERLADLRVHGVEITGDILQMFAPQFEKINQADDKSLHDLAGIIAETMSIHGAATELVEQEPWDLGAVYYSGIDHFSHRFMRFHAGKVPKDRATADILEGVVANAYRYHDLMLGRLLAVAGPGCGVMVLSDHGFHSDGLLPDYIPADAAGPTVEHRHFGIFCLRAPGVAAGERVYGASVLDIAPTVLHLFGLPAAEDMDGKVLINAFVNQPVIPPIASWEGTPGEDLPGDAGRHSDARRYDGSAAVESLKQLVALGYIAPPGEDAAKNVERSVAENRYNLARALMDAGLAGPAAEVLEELSAADPEQSRYHTHLFQCHLMQGELDEADRVLTKFEEACASFAVRAADELARRRAERPDESLLEESRAKRKRESYERRELAEKASGFTDQRLYMRTRLALANATTPEHIQIARRLVEELAIAAGRRPGPSMFLAEAFSAVGEEKRALFYSRRARRSDPDDWRAFALEARIHFAANRYRQAIARAVDSLALIYFQPRLHLLLGNALARLGKDDDAEREFRVTLSQMPEAAAAHEALAGMLRRKEDRLGEAGLHQAQARVSRQRFEKSGRSKTDPEPEPLSVPPFFERWDGNPPGCRDRTITVVSGLPRSGTSMMMQILRAAGISPFSDGKRAPDEDNPRGYLEHEQAASVHRDGSWLPSARGHAVKIVAQLVPYLPPGEEYRVILMLRDLGEVVASQHAMLAHLGRGGTLVDAEQLARTYTAQLLRVQHWLPSRPGTQLIAINYADALADAKGVVKKLATFLGEPFDLKLAAASIDAGFRHKRPPNHSNVFGHSP